MLENLFIIRSDLILTWYIFHEISIIIFFIYASTSTKKAKLRYLVGLFSSDFISYSNICKTLILCSKAHLSLSLHDLLNRSQEYLYRIKNKNKILSIFIVRRIKLVLLFALNIIILFEVHVLIIDSIK
jgi:hypothetical protein